MNPNQQLIEEFYAAFASMEPETMASCYHPEAHFIDPVFGKLVGGDIADMWRMLIERSGGKLQVSFSDIKADVIDGSANWTAAYEFTLTGRPIENRVHAYFIFRDGLIGQHRDDFDFYRWNRQAFGWKGWILGNTAWMQNKVRQQALASLRKWQSRRNA